MFIIKSGLHPVIMATVAGGKKKAIWDDFRSDVKKWMLFILRIVLLALALYLILPTVAAAQMQQEQRDQQFHQQLLLTTTVAPSSSQQQQTRNVSQKIGKSFDSLI